MTEPRLTKAEFQEWKSQVTTEQVFQAIRDYRKGWEQKSPLHQTAEMTFREAALREGVLMGLDALLEMEVDD